MKQLLILLCLLLFTLLVGLVISCGNPYIGGEEEETPHEVIPDPVDPAFWFKDIYDDLVSRDEHNTMGQVANCQYICDAINAKWNKNAVPAPGTELRAANCEYLLKMIDKYINNGETDYGTSEYATKQLVDTIAVDEAVAALGGKFLCLYSEYRGSAVNTYSGGLMYSINGTTWNKSNPLPLRNNFNNYALFSCGGAFFAMGNLTGSVYSLYRSVDGLSWTRVGSFSWLISTMAYGEYNGVKMWAAVGTAANGSTYVTYSTNGVDWSEVTVASTFNVYDQIKYLPNSRLFLLSGASISTFNFSTASIVGTGSVVTKAPIINNESRVAYGKGLYLSPGEGNLMYLSTDGVHWGFVLTNLPIGVYVRDLAFGSDMFVVATGNGIYSSYDGVDWELRLSGVDVRRVIHAGSEFIAIGTSNSNIYFSSGLVSWSSIALPNSPVLVDIAYREGIAIVVSNGAVYRSQNSDFRSWTRLVVAALTSNLARITAGPSSFVIVSPNSNFVLYSTVGSVWAQVQLPVTLPSLIPTISYGRGMFLISRTTNGFIQSTDGQNWTAVNTTGDYITNLSSISFVNNRYIAWCYARVGAGTDTTEPNLAVSSDVVNWTQAEMPMAFTVTGSGAQVVVGATPSKFPMLAFSLVIGKNPTNPAQLTIIRSLLYSTDGKKWLPSNWPFGLTWSTQINGLFYGKNNFLIYVKDLNTDNIRMSVSADGIDWETPIPVTAGVIDETMTISYDQNKFVSITTNLSTRPYRLEASISSDGINWSTPIAVGDNDIMTPSIVFESNN